MSIPAIFEHGIFRPLAPVALPDGTEVRIEVSTTPEAPSILRSPDQESHIDRVYGLLSLRFDGGDKEVAARHDEHQP